MPYNPSRVSSSPPRIGKPYLGRYSYSGASLTLAECATFQSVRIIPGFAYPAEETTGNDLSSSKSVRIPCLPVGCPCLRCPIRILRMGPGDWSFPRGSLCGVRAGVLSHGIRGASFPPSYGDRNRIPLWGDLGSLLPDTPSGSVRLYVLRTLENAGPRYAIVTRNFPGCQFGSRGFFQSAELAGNFFARRGSTNTAT